MNPFFKAYWTVKGIGWDNLPRRVLQVWRMRSGYLKKRLDPKCFSEQAFRENVAFSPDQMRDAIQNGFEHFETAGREMKAWSEKHVSRDLLQERLLTPCQKALQGDYLYFGHWYGKIGWPPDFNLDPLNGIRYPNDEHASKTAKSGPPRDDVKLVWEASRFTMGYYFARAYAHTQDVTWAHAFWDMFDAWLEQNPVMMSPSWGCGQESTFRMMAMLFGAAVTMHSEAATDERMLKLAKTVWQTGLLIKVNINYALSQENNHGISESVGLITAGKLLDIFEWESLGEKYLAHEIKRQVYDDGSFVQHSMNYHRVLMDDMLWAMTLLESYLPEGVGDRFARAADWLAELTDLKSGRVPNYGSNDGAQVLPLACCDYLDYRPVVQATQIRFHGKRPFEHGPWDEKAFWLFGKDIESAPPESQPPASLFAAHDGGYYVMRGPESWCMTRCHSYRDRPGKPDMLSFDLWFNGENILRQSGSYRYYTIEPVGKLFFKRTASQNTIEIDHADQMLKGPRFLWFYWTKSRLIRFEKNSENQSVFEGEHYGYQRLEGRLTHRRKIERNGDRWTVTDTVTAKKHCRHDIASRFRLAPGEWLQTETETSVSWNRDGFHVVWQKTDGLSASLITGRETPPEGWESLYYGEKTAAPTILISGKVDFQNAPLVLQYEFYLE